MKSYRLCENHKPLEATLRDTPQPQGTEVLLKVLAAGMCHSDLHLQDGTYDLGGGKQMHIKDRGFVMPLTLGHEAVGEVVAVGPQAQGVKVGDRGLAWSWIGCCKCKVCERGMENLCLKPRFLGSFIDGGFSTHLVLPHPRYLLGIGKLSPAEAAPLACAGITSFSALKKIDPAVLKSEPIVIIGAGGLGLMAVGLLKGLGARGAILVDLDPVKREAAKKAGALAAVDPAAKDAVDQIKQLTEGGAAAVVDFVGASKTVQLGIDCATPKGGQVVIVGLFGGDVTVPTAFFPMRALRVQGSYLGTTEEMRELLELVQRPGAQLTPVVTRPLDQVNSALQELREGKIVGRVVLIPA